jgi:hypothetical protein
LFPAVEAMSLICKSTRRYSSRTSRIGTAPSARCANRARKRRGVHPPGERFADLWEGLAKPLPAPWLGDQEILHLDAQTGAPSVPSELE